MWTHSCPCGTPFWKKACTRWMEFIYATYDTTWTSDFSFFKHQFVSLEVNSVINPLHKKTPKCMCGVWAQVGRSQPYHMTHKWCMRLTTLIGIPAALHATFHLMWSYDWDPNLCGQSLHTTQSFGFLSVSGTWEHCISLLLINIQVSEDVVHKTFNTLIPHHYSVCI